MTSPSDAPHGWVDLALPGFLGWVQSSEFERKYSRHTIRAMRVAILRFSDFVSKNEVFSAREVSSVVIRQYRRFMTEFDLKPDTMRQNMSLLDFFFDYLVFLGDASSNPVESFRADEKARKRRGGRVEARLPPVIMLADQDRIVQAAFHHDRSSNHRNAALIGFLLDSGLRISECGEMTIQQGLSLLEDGSTRIIGKGNKERRVVPMKNYMDHWQPWIEAQPKDKLNAPIFPSKVSCTADNRRSMSQPAVHQIVSTTMDRAGIVATQSGPHLLRHSAASRMLHEGRTVREVQETMGHESILTTERYIHLIV